MAKLPEEAFALAQKHGEMDKFAEALGDNGTPDDCKFKILDRQLQCCYVISNDW
jgi:hypothetical protein